MLPKCPFGHEVPVGAGQAGQSTACPECGELFVVPGAKPGGRNGISTSDSDRRLSLRQPARSTGERPTGTEGAANRFTRRNRYLGVAVTLVLGVLAGAVAWSWHIAEEQSTTARASQLAARSGQLAATAPPADRPAIESDERQIYVPGQIHPADVAEPSGTEAGRRSSRGPRPDDGLTGSGPPERRGLTDSSSPRRPAPPNLRTGGQVDFQPLIDLIQQTIEPNSWNTVGGAASIEGFAGGVWIDTNGLLRRREQQDGSGDLERLREQMRHDAPAGDFARPAALRKVSLPRLERIVRAHLHSKQPLPPEVRYLAGLQEVRHIFVYPEEQDVVIAGPADGWRIDAAGRAVGATSERPVVQLDDLVAILRVCLPSGNGAFGCGIFPRRERLAAVHDYLNGAPTEIEPARRPDFLRRLRDELGPQDIRVWGIAAGSHVGQVLVEADYRMKLVGIGLDPGGPAVPSYLDMIEVPPGTDPPAMETLRWWFTEHYDAVVASPLADAFQIRGTGVQVQSENELITPLGERVHTGRAEPNNARFARNFTAHFAALAEQEPVYAELRHMFDLSVLAAILDGHDVAQRIGWDYGCFARPDEYVIPLQNPPRTVETVINHRVIRDRHIVAAISGGVVVNPWPAVKRADQTGDSAAALQKVASESRRAPRSQNVWWWD
jgi:hypothetical protein